MSVPPLGNLRAPRSTNTRAIRRILSGDLLWDKRAVDRAATKRARDAFDRAGRRPRAHALDRTQRRWVLSRLPRWRFVAHSGTPVLTAPAVVSRADVEDLVAVMRLPYVQRSILHVAGLDDAQIQEVADRAPEHLNLIAQQGGRATRVRRSRKDHR